MGAEPVAARPVAADLVTTDLTVGGMTCAACVQRVEKKLGRLDGVTASVNLATGRARVSHPPHIGPGELVAVVERAGYTAALPEPPGRGREDGADGSEEGRTEGVRLLITALLALPVLVLSMVPAWQFRNWQWLCFVLAAPVAVWGAWPFHARAVRGLRHSTATMDTLVSLGVAASFSWSAYALFLGGAGAPGMRMPFSLAPAAADGAAHLYLEAAVGVPLFVLAGRFLEARARRGTGAALRSLARLAAKEVSVRQDGHEVLVPVERLAVGQVFVVRPGERVATDGEVVEGSSAVDLSLVTGESEPVEVRPGATVVGGAVNAGGLLAVRATAVGADTRLARITTVVLDKTGTLTSGHMTVARVTVTAGGLGREAVLRLAGAVERGSEHPLGRAIAAHARRSLPGRPLPDASGFTAEPGRGVRGRVEGRLVEVLAPDGELPAALAEALTAAEAAARTPVLVRVDGRAEALIEVGDVVRPGSYRAVDRLRRLGVRPVLATGDREAPARAVAAGLGIEEVHARRTPEDKARLVRDLRAQGRRVAVVGDGVNDAAALAAADLGIAMGSGTDVAIDAADVTLVRGDIEALADAVRLARRTLRTIRANLVWAFGYNAVTVPPALVGLLAPMPAAAAMSVSSLLVVGNSLRLRAWQPSPVRRRTR
ncbi:heavy metal translocating P-type ATPase [Streptomyces tricolor]|uniref:heavy metal translocating P-type ATPase n=1 Tax=Streptomyces tricolor TaxID=68277 RepID=UPI0036E7471F